jgi:hypothetical protein
VFAASYVAAPVYQNLWLVNTYAGPTTAESAKWFLCPAADTASLAPAPQKASGNYAVTFTSDGTTVDPRRCSYSVAYMYTSTGDIAPWYRVPLPSPDTAFFSDIAPTSGEIIGSLTVNTASTAGPPKSYNSRNHAGKGQNIAYADAHVEFSPNPLAGSSTTTAGRDNIFTSGGPSGPTPTGTPPAPGAITPIPALSPPWDIVMVPTRDSTGATH